MKIYNNLDNFDIERTVITVGTFDGIHLGHKKIINTLIQKAEKLNAIPVVFTFLPHPKEFFQKQNNTVKFLNNLSDKISLLESAGIKNIVVYPFNKEFSQKSSTNFIKDILVEKMNMKALIIGYDNHFGKDRDSNKEIVKQLSEQLHFEIETVAELKQNNQKINSTTIKKLLSEGKVSLANNLLSYNYNLKGKVVEGLKIGSKLGFPTANIKISDENKLIPANGVYAAKFKIENNFFDAVVNIGTNPTIVEKQNKKTIEVHILDFSSLIYGSNIEIEFIEYIRKENKFKTKEELIKQIKKDILKTKMILKNI